MALKRKMKRTINLPIKTSSCSEGICGQEGTCTIYQGATRVVWKGDDPEN